MVYGNGGNFLITYGEIYVLRTSYVRSGKYVSSHSNKERERTVTNVIEVTPFTMSMYLGKSGFSFSPE